METKESIFKVPGNFTEVEIAQMRCKIMAFNRLLAGRRLVIPLSDNLDLNYKRKKAGEIAGLVLDKPMKKYYIETVDLLTTDIVRLANGKVVIEFNGDEKLQFDLKTSPNDITTATPKDVNDAILEYEATGNKRFFWNAQMVTDVVTGLNKSNLKDIEAMIDELSSQGCALEQINKVTSEDTAAYYKSIDE
jgi:hypothetical protein